MSRFEAPPGIITNGLVLNLDAGDPDSYTRSQPPYVEVLVVAGGGGGSGNLYDDGAGGGAGGLIYNSAYQLTNAATITVTIGAGGAASTGGQGGDGGNSVFGSLTAVGGGGGGGHRSTPGRSGGSGGGSGGAYGATDTTLGGAGTPGQGFDGGTSVYRSYAGSGGGGAGGVGGTSSEGVGGNGANGQTYSISGTSTYYAGGGGGYGYSNSSTATGGLGGGGNGGNPSPLAPTAGGTNTGGGGGGGRTAGQTPFVGTATGGSGIVIVRYPGLPAATGGTITYLNGYTIHTFTTSGTFAPYLWNDVSGNGNDFDLQNGVSFISHQNYFDFDGTDDSAYFGGSLLNVDSFTVEAVVNITSVGDYNKPIFVVGNQSTTGIWFFKHRSGLGNRLVMHGYDGVNPRIDVDSVNAVPDAENVYVAVTFDGNAYQLYMDGETEDSPVVDNPVAPSNDNYIGRIGSTYLDGRVYNLRIYNRALSSTEITQNFNAQRNRFGI